MAVALLGSWVTQLTHAKESGANRFLTFFVHTEHSDGVNVVAVSAATYGDQPMTFVPTAKAVALGASFQATVEAWYLSEASVLAASGSDFAVAYEATPGVPDLVVYDHAFFSGANQSSLFGSSDTNFSLTHTPNPITTDALTNSSGDMVIAGVAAGNDGPYTVNNSFIEGSDQTTTSHTGATAHKVGTGAAEIPSFTYDDANPNRQAILGFVLQATAGGGSTTIAELSDDITLADTIDYFQTFTLTIGDSGTGVLLDNLDRGIDLGEPPANITAQRVAQEELSLSDSLAWAYTHNLNLADSFSFTEKIVAPVLDTNVLKDTFTFTDNLFISETTGDGWVRVGTPVGAWSAAAAPLPSSEFQTLGTLADVSGGIDFIPVLASGAKGGPYFTITVDRPVKLRSESNITSTPGLLP